MCLTFKKELNKRIARFNSVKTPILSKLFCKLDAILNKIPTEFFLMELYKTYKE